MNSKSILSTLHILLKQALVNDSVSDAVKWLRILNTQISKPSAEPIRVEILEALKVNVDILVGFVESNPESSNPSLFDVLLKSMEILNTCEAEPGIPSFLNQEKLKLLSELRSK